MKKRSEIYNKWLKENNYSLQKLRANILSINILIQSFDLIYNASSKDTENDKIFFYNSQKSLIFLKTWEILLKRLHKDS